MNYISLTTTLIALLFAGSVFERYRQRGGAHLLFWSLGALLYGLGSFSETLLSVGFNAVALKTWYLAGAMLTAPWLGQGTIFLLVRKRNLASILATVLLVVSLFAIDSLRVAPITAAAETFSPLAPVSEQYGEILIRNGIVITLTILLNLYGTLALAGGALYSAYLFWRKRVLANRLYGNILIAAGALLPASGGSFVLAGFVDWHSLSLLLGVILLYLGYIQAAKTPDKSV
ncbi:MAG: hypothetical protein JXB38_13840 [Anaerolineales bacterium]|nr:hypothetical protein [Anaerolineales bacterium]